MSLPWRLRLRMRSDRPHGDHAERLAQVMFSRLTRCKHSLLARSSATVCECPDQKPVIPKHPIMILLRRPCSKSSGMILLQRASAGSREENLLNRPNHLRICSLEDRCACGVVYAKSLRMISLQNAENNRPGMILLQKKWGGPSGVRESHGHQELSRVNKVWGCGRTFRAKPVPAANVMDIRSFAALAKTSGASRR
jgi:hypothetical protein